MRRLCFCFALGLLLTSCDYPAARFDTFAVNRPVNLAQEAGSEITLLGAKDTLLLQLQFDPASGSTRITNADDSSVILDARVFYRRGLYYAVEELEAGGCWVHAFRIHRNQVQGLATGYAQMEDLSTLVQHGELGELVRYRSFTDDSIRLRFDARQLRRFYRAELDSFPSYRLVATRSTITAVPRAAETAALSIYPNPAARRATLTFSTRATRTVQIYSSQGQLVQTIPTQSLSQDLAVQDWPAGTYVVRVSSPTAKAQTTRLLVRH